MTTFLVCIVVAFFFTLLVHGLDKLAHFLCSKPYSTSTSKLSKAKLVVVFVVIWGTLYGASYHQEQAREKREAAVQEWRGNMLKSGCKRTGYVTTRSSVYAVWTCPDGMVYREFEG